MARVFGFMPAERKSSGLPMVVMGVICLAKSEWQIKLAGISLSQAFDPLEVQHIVKIDSSIPKPLKVSLGVCQSKIWPVADLQGADRNRYHLGTFLL